MIEKTKKKKSLSHMMRSLHRDLGYFVIGLTLIYALSGILLSGRALGWLEHKYNIAKVMSTKIEKNKVLKNLIQELKKGDFNNIPSAILIDANRSLRHYKFKNEKDDTYIFKARKNTITYNYKTGEINYLLSAHPPWIKKFITAHKASHQNAWFYLAILYSIILSFLAISAMFMVKGKFGFKKRGIYIMFSGFIVIFIFLYFS